MLDDLFKAANRAVSDAARLINEVTAPIGQVVGSVVGLSAGTIAATLSIPVTVVQEALDAGCASYEEIREHCRRP
jgi:hypothetical protein